MTPEQLAENAEVKSLVTLLASIDSEIDRRQAIGNDVPGLASISRLFSQKASTVKALTKLKEALHYYQDGQQIQEAEKEKRQLWADLVATVCGDDAAAFARYREFLFSRGLDERTEEDVRHAEQAHRVPHMRAEFAAQQAGDAGLLAQREARLATLLADVEELRSDIEKLKKHMGNNNE